MSVISKGQWNDSPSSGLFHHFLDRNGTAGSTPSVGSTQSVGAVNDLACRSAAPDATPALPQVHPSHGPDMMVKWRQDPCDGLSTKGKDRVQTEEMNVGNLRVSAINALSRENGPKMHAHLLFFIRIVITCDIHICLLKLFHERFELCIVRLTDDFRLHPSAFDPTTLLTFILTVRSPPSFPITSPIASTAFSITSIACTLSVLVVVMTYNGGATNRTVILTSSVDASSPASKAFRIASIPAYAKHFTSTSARTLTGLGVILRAMVLRRSSRVSGSRDRVEKTRSGSLSWVSASDPFQWRSCIRHR